MYRIKYRIRVPFRALKLDRDIQRLVCTLPTEAELDMATISEIPGFVEVMFNGERYRVFETDLLRNCDTEVTASEPDD
jgi:hypothetical protein